MYSLFVCLCGILSLASFLELFPNCLKVKLFSYWCFYSLAKTRKVRLRHRPKETRSQSGVQITTRGPKHDGGAPRFSCARAPLAAENLGCYNKKKKMIEMGSCRLMCPTFLSHYSSQWTYQMSEL